MVRFMTGLDNHEIEFQCPIQEFITWMPVTNSMPPWLYFEISN